MISKKHKIYSFGSLNVNDNSVSTKTKFKLNLFLKENHNRLLYTCIYYDNKCHKRYVNTKLTKKELSNNLKNIFLTVTYKDKNGNVVSLAEQNLKINTNGNGTKRVLPNNTFVEPYLKLNDKEIDNKISLMSYLDMTKKELYEKYNNKKIRVNNNSYSIKIVEDKKIIYISQCYNYYFVINLFENSTIIETPIRRDYITVKNRTLVIKDYKSYLELNKIIKIIKDI